MNREVAQDIEAPEALPPAAALEHLTGPSRGTMTWLAEPEVELTLDARRLYASVDRARPGEDPVAHLHRDKDGYVIEAIGGHRIWVNGRPISTRPLRNHDVIEFCDDGPISRYFLYDSQHRPRHTVSDLVGDAFAYLRTSRQPIGRRLVRCCGQLFGGLARETSIVFRLGVVVALILLGWLAYQQSRINAMQQEQLVSQQQQIETGTAQRESFSRTLARAQDEALTAQDLEALALDIGAQVVTTAERVSALEARSGATGRVIANALSSVVFLQGAYGFKDMESGRMLRHVVGEDGKPAMLPNGLPVLSLDGEGPVATRQFTGTGFAASDDNLIVTNRHVGRPWEHEDDTATLAGRGLQPEMVRFVVYLPGVEAAQSVEVVKVSEEADVAVLRHDFAGGDIAGLRLASASPTPGAEVIVMGYPTGLRSILAQAGKVFVEELRKTEGLDFWTIAERLSIAGRIIPLASRGIVGRVTEETIVYDAETTHGGSGGPVLNLYGEVVAVNAAILPEFGGSNLGVPVEMVHRLLAEDAAL